MGCSSDSVLASCRRVISVVSSRGWCPRRREFLLCMEVDVQGSDACLS